MKYVAVGVAGIVFTLFFGCESLKVPSVFSSEQTVSVIRSGNTKVEKISEWLEALVDASPNLRVVPSEQHSDWQLYLLVHNSPTVFSVSVTLAFEGRLQMTHVRSISGSSENQVLSVSESLKLVVDILQFKTQGKPTHAIVDPSTIILH